jgi:hypothetical protein
MPYGNDDRGQLISAVVGPLGVAGGFLADTALQLGVRQVFPGNLALRNFVNAQFFRDSGVVVHMNIVLILE